MVILTGYLPVASKARETFAAAAWLDGVAHDACNEGQFLAKL
jgi:hypothetical protein